LLHARMIVAHLDVERFLVSRNTNQFHQYWDMAIPGGVSPPIDPIQITFNNG